VQVGFQCAKGSTYEDYLAIDADILTGPTKWRPWQDSNLRPAA
jgi:hypothetical protein